MLQTSQDWHTLCHTSPIFLPGVLLTHIPPQRVYTRPLCILHHTMRATHLIAAQSSCARATRPTIILVAFRSSHNLDSTRPLPYLPTYQSLKPFHDFLVFSTSLEFRGMTFAHAHWVTLCGSSAGTHPQGDTDVELGSIRLVRT